jgi:hypothetical protein
MIRVSVQTDGKDEEADGPHRSSIVVYDLPCFFIIGTVEGSLGVLHLNDSQIKSSGSVP